MKRKPKEEVAPVVETVTPYVLCTAYLLLTPAISRLIILIYALRSRYFWPLGSALRSASICRPSFSSPNFILSSFYLHSIFIPFFPSL
jgi:hypothetical protein